MAVLQFRIELIEADSGHCSVRVMALEAVLLQERLYLVLEGRVERERGGLRGRETSCYSSHRHARRDPNAVGF